jgi:hypothetical protein
MSSNNKELSAEQRVALAETLRNRFQKNLQLHPNIQWQQVQARLELRPDKMWSLNEMEISGGEPDVITIDNETGECVFYDCSAETPKGRRSVCYDQEALEARKEYKPANSAVNMAAQMGVEMLNEAQYRELQQIGNFDAKSSSWIVTPPEIRKLGGAVFADFRYGQVFVYHNGADSYYAVRGFRARLKV